MHSISIIYSLASAFYDLNFFYADGMLSNEKKIDALSIAIVIIPQIADTEHPFYIGIRC